jgi:glycosyltransferase involved in cell wall biosynthesis
MVVTEAAACGTPAIVTNVTGLSDSVVSHITGLIISSNPTEYELFLNMERIILDQKFREKSSREALKRAKRYNWHNTYVEFKSILQKKITE